ncbi:patatin-like phospholipase family protein [Chitinophaga agrisoli]|uniref:Patatin-like phospholipase family protein n=1 Tax=Chitinophaga agrisoli TaxID=2607653 RepID=A0A5B2VQJ6_9BACT|nr:patatin-like phospholipase family protein [Chitinophaga agrisoli]KAA2240512.1 patatin-like phospholipase family protein [Chitinophaga agrisoli]
MAKTALVVSGGGSKGAFAVGVIKYLTENRPDIQFDTLCGTSTGSLIVPLVALGETNLLEILYTTQTTADVVLTGNILNRFLRANSLYDATPLARQITNIITEERFERLAALRKELFLTGVCLQTGRITYFSTTGMPMLNNSYDVVKLTTAQAMREAVLASACQPVFMPPIEVSAVTEKPRQFVDGGLREYAPIQLAIDNGATEIYAILLTPETPPISSERFSSAFDILEQTIDWFTTDVAVNDVQIPLLYNRALEYLAAVKQKMQDGGIPAADIDKYFDIPGANPFLGKRSLTIHLIRPDAPLGGGPGGLEFDPTEMKGMLAKGMEVAERLFS